MVSASDRVTLQGKPIDRLTAERFKSFNRLVKSAAFGGEKSDITVVQAIGGASASAGTHKAPGGSLDYTAFNQKNRVKASRLFGGAAWYRAALRGVWAAHIHDVTAGVGYAPPLARGQVTAMYAGRNGLANNGKDTGPRLKVWPLFVAPWTDRGKRGTYYAKKGVTMRTEGTDKASSAGSLPKGGKFTVIGIVNAGGVLWAINVNGKHVRKSDLTLTKPKATAKPKPSTPSLPTQSKGETFRIGTFNFPDKTKITTVSEQDRIAVAVRQITAAGLDMLAVQEGVGSTPDGSDSDPHREPSDLMFRLDKALGSDWDIVEPTTACNENYFLRRKSTTDVRVHDDAIIRGTLGGKTLPGRHVSRVTATTAIGALDLGNAHLVSSNRPGAEVQAGLAASALAQIGGSTRRVLLGDLNTSGPLTALTRAGLKDSRLIAKATTYRDRATYTNYAKAVPSTDLAWIIDHIWVSDGITVNGYTVVLDLDAAGKFRLPRASDHALTIVSLS